MTDGEWHVIKWRAMLDLARDAGWRNPMIGGECAGALADHVIEAEIRLRAAETVLYGPHFRSPNR